jgi:hypothetical protein
MNNTLFSGSCQEAQTKFFDPFKEKIESVSVESGTVRRLFEVASIHFPKIYGI